MRLKNAWRPPKLWDGETAFLIGGGPSIADLDINRLRDKNVIVINNAYQLAPWAPFLYFMDCAWWDWHEEELINWPNFMVTVCQRLQHSKRVKWFRRGKRHEYDERPGYLSNGPCSGHGAICLAVRLGATRVVLLGFDMHSENGHNYHKDHKREVPATIYEDNYIVGFEKLRDTLPPNVQVVNATPGTKMATFPLVDLDSILEM